MNILSYIKSKLSKPDPPVGSDDFMLQKFKQHEVEIAAYYDKVFEVHIQEQSAQTIASQEAQLKGNTNMNFILFSSNVASIILAVEAMATAYTEKSGQVIPGADKLKSVIALVESAGESVLAFIPNLEGLIKTLVQQYNDSGLFKKAAVAA